MTAQEAILAIIGVFDEGNREMEKIIEVHGMHSLKAGDLITRTENSIMFRVGEIVRRYEKSGSSQQLVTDKSKLDESP
ncbi:MAG: hypothetical protein WCL39_03730 [Armatimonadota bacterium]